MSQSDNEVQKNNEVHTLIHANGRKCKQTAVLGILKYLALPYKTGF
jgi:hypothetical protein